MKDPKSFREIWELLRKNRSMRIVSAILAVWIPYTIHKRYRKRVVVKTPAPTQMSFSKFLQHVEAHEIEKVLLASDVLTFLLKGEGDKVFFTNPVTVHPGVVDLLHEKKVPFDQLFEKQKFNFSNAFITMVPFLYLAACCVVFYKFYDQTGDLGTLHDKDTDVVDGKEPTSFDDVAGIDATKSIVQEVSDFLKNPSKYTSVGARLPTGILLVGPPGTGKTMLARAIANDANLPFFYCSGSDFVEIYAGRGAQRVRKLFAKAKAAAPSLVFFDEIDALGKARGMTDLNSNEEREQTLNQLLAAMDGFDSSASVVVMAATNRYDVLDKALTRPGRFDRIVKVPLPDQFGREEILRVHCKGKMLRLDTDLELVAKMTPNFTGAELNMLCNEAAIRAAREQRKCLDTPDFLGALEEMKSSRSKRSTPFSNILSNIGGGLN